MVRTANSHLAWVSRWQKLKKIVWSICSEIICFSTYYLKLPKGPISSLRGEVLVGGQYTIIRTWSWRSFFFKSICKKYKKITDFPLIFSHLLPPLGINIHVSWMMKWKISNLVSAKVRKYLSNVYTLGPSANSICKPSCINRFLVRCSRFVSILAFGHPARLVLLASNSKHLLFIA